MSETLNSHAIHRSVEALAHEVTRLQGLLGAAETVLPAARADAHPYVERVPTVLSGEPVIAGTRTPVRAIVEYWKFGASPEEIAEKLPHLRLAQIFGALSYYDDYREEIERYIALNRVPVDDEG